MERVPQEGLRNSDLMQKPKTTGQAALQWGAQPSLLAGRGPMSFKATGGGQDGLGPGEEVGSGSWHLPKVTHTRFTQDASTVPKEEDVTLMSQMRKV